MTNEPVRIIVFKSSAEASFRRYIEELPGFDEVYSAIANRLSIEPTRGWNTCGGYYEYLLAPSGKPWVRVLYTFDLKEVVIRQIEAQASLLLDEESLEPQPGPR